MTSKGSVRTDKLAQDVLKQTCDMIRQHSIEFPDTGALCKRLMRRIKEKFPPGDSQQEDKTEGINSDSEEVEIDRLLRKIHKENEVMTTFPFDIGFTLGAEEEKLCQMTYYRLKGLVEETKNITRERILAIWKGSKKNFSVIRAIIEFAVAAPSKAEMLVGIVKEIAIEEIDDMAMFKKVVTNIEKLAFLTVHVCLISMIQDEKGDDDTGRIIVNSMEFVGHLSLNKCASSEIIDNIITNLFMPYSLNPVKTAEVLIRSVVRLLIICGHCVDKRVIEKTMIQMRNVVNRVDEETRTQINKLETLIDNGWK